MRRATITVGTALAATWAVPAAAAVLPRLCRALGIPRDRIADGAVACLTFDDGPHPEGTPAALEALRAADARATFFLAGEQAERFPAIAAEIVAAGHDIALHCHRHRNQLRLSPRAVADDLERGAAAVAAASGVEPGLYRPPYGIFSAGGLVMVRRAGYDPLLWTRWGHDWRRSATAESIAAETAQELEAGDVILLHDSDAYSSRDSWRATAAALPAILERIEAAGLKAAPA